MHEPLDRDGTIGTFLCEVCYDAMTDETLDADASPTGVAMAVCEACQGLQTVERWVCGGTWDEAQRFLREKHLSGVLRRWEAHIVLDATSLLGRDAPVVYLVGGYAQREDWAAIAAALQACQARCYPA